MSEKFNGFSQEEINKVSGYKNGKKPTQNQNQNGEMIKQAFRNPIGIRRMPDKVFKQADQLRKQLTRGDSGAKTAAAAAEKPVNENNNNNVNGVNGDSEEHEDTLNLDRTMSKSLEDALFFAPNTAKTNGHQAKIKSDATSATTVDSESGSITSNATSTDDSSILKINSQNSSNSTDDSTLLQTPNSNSSVPERLNTESPFKGISLKDFELHRKMIEEQNKQKKQLLYKAIEQHTQKTAAEVRKIEEIRQELGKLESDLAVDVAVLRKQIDNACIHFSHVEKQYMRVESQFLKAKMELHSAAEKKELLTEHLCTVIAHNEDRKAQKLTELMQKVGLAPNEEYTEPTAMPGK